MNSDEIVEQIMTQHWDMKSCDCWVCHTGREAGLSPKETHLKTRYPTVLVDEWKLSDAFWKSV